MAVPEWLGATSRACLPDGRCAHRHGLRHTYTSLQVEAGVHAKIIADALGHGSVEMTLDRYAHAGAELQRRTAEALETHVFGS